MARYHRALLVAAVSAVLGFIPAAYAQTAKRCDLTKLHATATSGGHALRCQARATENGAAPSAACSAPPFERLVSAFDKAEARSGCQVIGNAVAVYDEMDGFVAHVTSTLVPSPSAGSCAAAKLRVTGRMLTRSLACHAPAIRDDAEVEGSCSSAATARLIRAFERVEGRGDCVTQDDAPDVANEIAATVYELAYLVETGMHPGDGTPSALNATLSGATIHLSWTNALPESGNTHAKLLRRLNETPNGPDDVFANVVFFGTAESADDDLTALLPDTTDTPRTYHYAVFGCTSGGSCETLGSRTTFAPTLSEALRAGGYVLHWRHAAADVCADRTDLGPAATTSVPDWWRSCDAQCPPGGGATARQMNAMGVTQSTAIGDAFRTREFEIGRVVSSEFCRNVGTAQLMAFPPPIEQSPLITFFVYDEPARCSNSYALISEVPAAGTNTALIGHAGFTCAVLQSLAWGEAAIFKPDGAGGTQFVARVLWDGWLSLP